MDAARILSLAQQMKSTSLQTLAMAEEIEGIVGQAAPTQAIDTDKKGSNTGILLLVMGIVLFLWASSSG